MPDMPNVPNIVRVDIEPNPWYDEGNSMSHSKTRERRRGTKPSPCSFVVGWGVGSE